MGKYIVKRVLQFIPVFLGVTLILFALQNIVPGDPIKLIGGDKALSPEVELQLRVRYHLVQTDDDGNAILDENGDPASPDYRHSKMQLNTVVTNGRIIAAQNVYDDGTVEAQDIQDAVFTERQRVIDPIVTGADSEAAFAFQDCDSFRVIVNSSDFTQMPSITFVYVYNVDAVNPLDFTQISNDSLAVKMDLSHDNNGKLAASYELIKTVTADAQQ